MMQAQYVLLADDDQDIQVLIQKILQSQGLKVICADNGVEALRKWTRHPIDLFILDWMMPVMDGLETLMQIRRVSNVPVILLTVKSQEADIVAGFTAGANDYIVKPFSQKEFLARVKTRLRRGWQDLRPAATALQYGGLVLDLKKKTVRCNDQPIELARLEFHLLAYLLSHAGMVISKQELLENVWGYHNIEADLNLVEAVVTRLRRKIQGNQTCLESIQTVRGAGYRLGE